jgi:hypothetical protein
MQHIYAITDIGNSFAAQPSNHPSEGLKVLYFLRRHGGRATDDQLEQFVIPDRSTLQVTLNKLRNAKAVNTIG